MLTRTEILAQSASVDEAGRGHLPRHVAIIMDGNGRWAESRGLPRSFGHRKGVEAVRRTVRHAARRGIGYLTLYAFSIENWNRPEAEVGELMSLIRRYIDTDLEELATNDIRIRVIGARQGLSAALLEAIERAERRTAGNGGMTLVVAFNYGGRNEIVRAARRAARAAIEDGIAPDAIDEATFAGLMDTASFPDPDLLIRTSGEQRISNFLLWQCAYAEFVFTEAMWPEFDEAEFDRAIENFRLRDRRFGELPARFGAR